MNRVPLIGLGILATIGAIIAISKPVGTSNTVLTIPKADVNKGIGVVTHIPADKNRTYMQFCNPTTTTATLYIEAQGEHSFSEIAPGFCYTDNSPFVSNVIDVFSSSTDSAVTGSDITIIKN